MHALYSQLYGRNGSNHNEINNNLTIQKGRTERNSIIASNKTGLQAQQRIHTKKFNWFLSASRAEHH